MGTPLSKGFDALSGELAGSKPWTEGWVTTDGDDITGFAAVGYEAWNHRLRLRHVYMWIGRDAEVDWQGCW